ncbi:unnamed protein product [Bursaphelenchus xylophilus]|uniref:(pine wood nematode) hypothetical protein n=1 Tax=Bursaphelenchus xylophilus TaxID=6326 RepID=A0A7I8XKJ2_BURXY|nr:unnamed protein product [Bursaphelenchus xylophilus]CAG9118352.1 unnamed protein product [Bursaphelenchus xylophilus]
MRQFWNAQHFHENLRKCTLLLNLIICFSPVLHPITFYLAQEESPITNGRTDYAVILYTAQILHHISLLFLHTKFFILVVERALAYRQRKVYENARNSYVLQMMVVTLLLCLLEISSKLLAYAIISSEDNVDVWLSKAFTVEKSPSYFLFTYSLSACSGLVGYVSFQSLLRRAKVQRHKSQTLSERFELRQTEIITNIMLPLCSGYCLCVASCFAIPIAAIRLIVFGGGWEWQKFYQIIVLYSNWMIGVYNLGATVYTMRKIKAMSAKNSRRTGACSPNNETERYFKQLAEQWAATQSRK